MTEDDDGGKRGMVELPPGLSEHEAETAIFEQMVEVGVPQDAAAHMATIAAEQYVRMTAEMPGLHPSPEPTVPLSTLTDLRATIREQSRRITEQRRTIAMLRRHMWWLTVAWALFLILLIARGP